MDLPGSNSNDSSAQNVPQYGLRRILSLLTYAEAGVLIRVARLLILIEHYWIWSRVHLREGGVHEVYARIRGRLNFWSKGTNKAADTCEGELSKQLELGIQVNGKPRLMIVCPDVIGKKRVGLAVRHWEIAHAMSKKGFPVTLVTPRGTDLDAGVPFTFVPAADAKMVERLCYKHDAVLYQGSIITEFPFLRSCAKKLIVDLVCPIHLEELDSGREVSYQHSLSLVHKWLEHGDFYICGNERQRDYWLGLLSATGRILDGCRSGDRTLRAFIDVVPFGIPDEEPTKVNDMLRGVVPGIDRDSIVYLWWGGIWDWLDPDTPVRAAIAAHKKNPSIRLWFSNLYHPNGQITVAAKRAVELAKSLGGLNSVVFFNDYPIAYDQRSEYLLSADVGLISEQPNLETRFAARTRALDYWWARLPVLCAHGDQVSDFVREQNIGVVVQYDLNSWMQGFLRCADPILRNRMTTNIEIIRESLKWSHAVEPIERFCRGCVNPSTIHSLQA